jgi:hypothetical protein
VSGDVRAGKRLLCCGHARRLRKGGTTGR